MQLVAVFCFVSCSAPVVSHKTVETVLLRCMELVGLGCTDAKAGVGMAEGKIW